MSGALSSVCKVGDTHKGPPLVTLECLGQKLVRLCGGWGPGERSQGTRLEPPSGDACPACLLHFLCPVPHFRAGCPKGLFSNELPAPEFSAGDLLPGTFPKRVANPSVCVADPPGLPPTLLAEVVHEDDLLQEGPGRRVQDAVHGAQEGGPGLVVETEDDAGRGQAGLRPLLPTPAGTKTREPWGREASAGAQRPRAPSPGRRRGCSNRTALLPVRQLSLGLLKVSREEGPGHPCRGAACSLPRAPSRCLIPTAQSGWEVWPPFSADHCPNLENGSE